jgi:DNA-binding transcriptional regulator GbsR (MarR family)
MNAKEYIKYLLSIENYSFSLDEIAKETAGSSNSLKFELLRLSTASLTPKPTFKAHQKNIFKKTSDFH